MSSQPRDPGGHPASAEPSPAEPAPAQPVSAKPKWYSYWPKWRRIMMGGAVTLLVGSLIPAIVGAENAPAGVSNVTYIIGYGLLAYGFFLAMRARSAPTDIKKEDQTEILEEET